MDKKKLSLREPYIYTYTAYGALFSILDEESLPWIFSNFFQIRYACDWGMTIFENHINLFEDCPYLEFSNIIVNDEIELNNNTSIQKIIIDRINHNEYVYMYLDWYYIVKDNFNQHFAHTALISGYDLIKRIFFVSDNFEKGKFVTIEIDIDIVEQAFWSAQYASVGNLIDNKKENPFIYLNTLSCFKKKDGIIFNFDINILKEQIYNYLYSKKSKFNNTDQLYHNGIQCIEIVISELLGNKMFRIGLRDFHLLYEQKLLMYKRMEYMIENKIITDKNIREQSKEVFNAFTIIRNLYLKYIEMQNREIAASRVEETKYTIINYIQNATEMEHTLLHNLLSQIEGQLIEKDNQSTNSTVISV